MRRLPKSADVEGDIGVARRQQGAKVPLTIRIPEELRKELGDL
jgi:hypothetical protein